MAITIKDIATLSGVSRGTVDRVLNGRGKVSEKNKKKILEIAKQHGYIKNIIASKLASQSEYKIAIVIPDPNEDIFWQSPLNGIKKNESFLSNYGFKLEYFFFSTESVDSYVSSFQDAIYAKPQAILCAPVFFQESLRFMQIAQQNEIPFVCINSEIEHKDILCYIGQNSYQCGTIAGRLFHQKNRLLNKVAAITLGRHDNATHIEAKIKGLKDYNEVNPFAKEILDLDCQNFDDNKDFESFCTELKEKHPDINAFFITNSRSYVFFNKLNELNISFPNTINIGFDLVPKNLDYLENGEIQYLLNQNPMKQGYLGMMNLFNYFIYKKEIKRSQFLPIDIIVKENYENYLEQASYEIELAF